MNNNLNKVKYEEPCDGRLSSTVPREGRGETPRHLLNETRGIIYPAETKNGRGGKKQKWVAEISVNNQRYRFQSTNRGNVTAWLKGMNAGVASRGKKMTLETYKEMQRVLSGLAREIDCSIQDPDTKKTRSATAHLNSRKKGVNEAKKCLRQYFFEKIKTA